MVVDIIGSHMGGNPKSPIIYPNDNSTYLNTFNIMIYIINWLSGGGELWTIADGDILTYLVNAGHCKWLRHAHKAMMTDGHNVHITYMIIHYILCYHYHKHIGTQGLVGYYDAGV